MYLLTESENILIVDDDKDILNAYKTLLKQQNKIAYVCDNPLEAINVIPTDWYGVAVVDIYMPYVSGIELMEKIHQIDAHIPVLLVTGHGDVPMAVDAVKKGAFDFLEKPINPKLFIDKINLALAEREQYLKRKLQKQQQITEHLIGESSWIKQLREKILSYSLISLPIYLFGPAGTGKLLAAKQLIPNDSHYPVQIHNLQQMDAFDQFDSWIEQATGGALILQHVDLLPAKYQKRLVHYQAQPDHKFRLIVTSRKRPEQLATQQILLPEFYYLFALTQIECLSLQQRKKDIVVIFEYYLKIACKRLAKKRPNLNSMLIKTLNNRLWENNVSELIHAAELFVVGLLPTNDHQSYYDLNQPLSLEQHIEKYEKDLIIKALDMYQGRINEVADYLQIPRKKLYLRMKKYGLDKSHFKY